jgi:hypothetical protein
MVEEVGGRDKGYKYQAPEATVNRTRRVRALIDRTPPRPRRQSDSDNRNSHTGKSVIADDHTGGIGVNLGTDRDGRVQIRSDWFEFQGPTEKVGRSDLNSFRAPPAKTNNTSPARATTHAHGRPYRPGSEWENQTPTHLRTAHKKTDARVSDSNMQAAVTINPRRTDPAEAHT